MTKVFPEELSSSDPSRSVEGTGGADEDAPSGEHSAPRILWAPWRMEYILGPRNKGECIFCARPGAPEPELRSGLVLAVGQYGAVLLNKYPFAAGHLLVVPRRHVSLISELSADEAAGFFRWVQEAGARVRRAAQPPGINYGINEGAAAGAGIAEHLHAHLVPRWPGDLNFMPVIANVRVMPEHLDATWLRLRPAFEDMPD